MNIGVNQYMRRSISPNTGQLNLSDLRFGATECSCLPDTKKLQY